jgi:hypothetical protein
MNTKIVTLCAAVILMVSAGHAQEATDVADAEKAARQWLTLTDAERYGESWDAAASVFQTRITLVNWTNALANARTPLGKLLSRTLSSAKYSRSLPGAPDGEYVVIQYTSQFENKPTATELVTPTKEKDGKWRVSGYFIR